MLGEKRWRLIKWKALDWIIVMSTAEELLGCVARGGGALHIPAWLGWKGTRWWDPWYPLGQLCRRLASIEPVFGWCVSHIISSKHEMSNQYWLTVFFYWGGFSAVSRSDGESGSYPANTRHWTNAVLMLSHRLRRWANIKTALVQCLVFAGQEHKTLTQCWATVGPPSATLVQPSPHCVNVVSYIAGNFPWNKFWTQQPPPDPGGRQPIRPDWLQARRG